MLQHGIDRKHDGLQRVVDQMATSRREKDRIDGGIGAGGGKRGHICFLAEWLDLNSWPNCMDSMFMCIAICCYLMI